LIHKPFINNQIRSSEVRLIDETGKQLGVISLTEALNLAKEKNLDLIQVTEKVEPPVCKIMDYGKYLYIEEKKEKEMSKQKGGEVKGIRLSFNISSHDIEIRAKAAEKFLKEGDRVRIDLILKGRQKALDKFAKDKMLLFLETLDKIIPIKLDRDLKREPRGYTALVSKE
jgi:translation initiation factor IF-3